MNRKNLTKTALILGACLLGVAAAPVFELPDAKVTVRVRDQDGNAVTEANLKVTGDSAALQNDPATFKEGVSNKDGLWEVQLKSRGEVAVTVDKSGFYRSENITYNYRAIPNELERALSRKRWEPWNPNIEVILKRVINPAAMYARGVTKGLPSTSEPTGFDLLEGDFVQPHGRGKVSDLIFAPDLKDRSADDYDFQVVIKFSNLKDGIVPFAVLPPLTGSVLRSPHQAPDAGYLAEWMVWRSRRPTLAESSNYDPDKHAYFIRVRTTVDEKGNIVSANYGKIYGDFMKFTYYLNPKTNDRNVEFDPKRNLFQNLKDSDEVVVP